MRGLRYPRGSWGQGPRPGRSAGPAVLDCDRSARPSPSTMEARALAETGPRLLLTHRIRSLEPNGTSLDWLPQWLLPAPHSVATRTLGCWFQDRWFRPTPAGLSASFRPGASVGGDTGSPRPPPARPARPGPAGPARNSPA